MVRTAEKSTDFACFGPPHLRTHRNAANPLRSHRPKGDPRVPWQGWISWFVARLGTPVFVSRDGARRLGCPGAAVIPAGVDVEVFRPRRRAEARAALGWPDRGHYILLPGARGTPRKGAPLFDAVVQEVRRRVSDVTPVSLEGFSRKQVIDVMNAVDVTLMTSEFEGSPVATKESLACMTPVVSVPVGDLPELLAELPACAVAPRDPGEGERLAVVLMQPRDVDLKHPVAMT